MSKTIGERFTNIQKCTLTRESKAQWNMLNAHNDQSSETKSKGLHTQVLVSKIRKLEWLVPIYKPGSFFSMTFNCRQMKIVFECLYLRIYLETNGIKKGDYLQWYQVL